MRSRAGEAFSDMGQTAYARVIEAVPQGCETTRNLIGILLHSRNKELMPTVVAPRFPEIEKDLDLRLQTVMSNDPEFRMFTRCDTVCSLHAPYALEPCCVGHLWQEPWRRVTQMWQLVK